MTSCSSCVIAHGLLVASVWLCSDPLPAQEKQPVPSAAAQSGAMKLVTEVYGEERIKAITPEAKSSLANKILESAEKAADPTDRFVLLRAAGNTAMQAGDADLAMQIIDQMDRWYVIDAFQMKTEVLFETAESAHSKEQQIAVARHTQPLIDQAVRLDDFDLALRLFEVGIPAAQKARQGELREELEARQKQVKSLSQEYAKLSDARKRLDIDPVDPEANLALGKYHCFRKNGWRKGLHMLVLGGDLNVKQLATNELNGIALPDEQVKQADGWWDLAEKESGSIRSNLLARAYTWYREAALGLGVLQRQRAEKRCASIEESVTDLEERLAAQGAQGLVIPDADATAEAIELGLKWLVTKQGQDGSWTFATGPNGGNLIQCSETATAMALIPLLRAGHTHRVGAYKESIEKGLIYLTGRMKVSKNGGSFYREGSRMYGHGICAIALGEAYAHSKDRSLRAPAQAAINYIVYAQDPKGGGWRYQPRQPGDTSVLGWQMQALKAAQAADLTVPRPTMQLAWKYLDSVQANNGTTYGYTGPGSSTATTAIGLWSRLQMGRKPNDPTIQGGVKFCVDSGPFPKNYYLNYYVSCLLKACGQGTGDEWSSQIDRYLVESQSKVGDTAGSWFTGDGDHGCTKGGRLYCTSMALMTLQNLSNTGE